MSNTASHYKSAGVNLEAGDSASNVMYRASRATWSNRQGLAGEISLPVDSFSGVRFIESEPLQGAIIGMNFDGIGTKVELAERVGRHRSMAHDLFAMVCDDAAIRGCEPLVFGSILDCSSIDRHIVEELAEGMVDAAKLSRVAVINGEIAELGNRVSGYGMHSYNWGGAVIWAARRERLLSGLDIAIGHDVVAVRETGVRSNGISLLRRIFQKVHGDSWHAVTLGTATLGEHVLAPSIIYTPLLTALTGGLAAKPGAVIVGAAHITGGGIPGKLGRLLKPRGLGADLDNLFEPSHVITHCQELGSVPDSEAYRVWNMGQGLLIVTPDAPNVIQIARSMGFQAQHAGQITSRAEITLKSEGTQRGERLTFAIN
jgi:phosphoribosylformylglycinamidine cyclo-ligase